MYACVCVCVHYVYECVSACVCEGLHVCPCVLKHPAPNRSLHHEGPPGLRPLSAVWRTCRRQAPSSPVLSWSPCLGLSRWPLAQPWQVVAVTALSTRPPPSSSAALHTLRARDTSQPRRTSVTRSVTPCDARSADSTFASTVVPASRVTSTGRQGMATTTKFGKLHMNLVARASPTGGANFARMIRLCLPSASLLRRGPRNPVLDPVVLVVWIAASHTPPCCPRIRTPPCCPRPRTSPHPPSLVVSQESRHRSDPAQAYPQSRAGLSCRSSKGRHFP
jgi:hypothetical protein